LPFLRPWIDIARYRHAALGIALHIILVEDVSRPSGISLGLMFGRDVGIWLRLGWGFMVWHGSNSFALENEGQAGSDP